MNKKTKIIIVSVLVVCVLGIWGYKTITEKKAAANNVSFVEKNLPMLVDLGAGTCIPCKEMVPILEEVTKLYKGKAVVKVIDVYENPKETQKYRIRAIPTQIFIDKNGKEVFRHEGFFSKEEIIKVFDKMGVK